MASNLTCKISEKGAVSVMGLQRFPVTLYASQWQDLAAVIPGIVKFINDPANKAKLATKEAKQTASGVQRL